MATHAQLPLWQDASPAERTEKLRAMVDDLYRAAHADALEKIIAMLESYEGEDDKERADARHIASLCRAHPNILWSNCEVGHVTGSALVIDPRGRRVLLNHHRKFDRWMQFGGHAEFETESWRVALREATEESGLSDLRFVPDASEPTPFDVDVHVVRAQGGRPQHEHLDLRYLLATDRPANAQSSHESNAIQWFGFDDALAMGLEPNVKRMIRKAMRRMEHDLLARAR